jgi:hypothetical protein
MVGQIGQAGRAERNQRFEISKNPPDKPAGFRIRIYRLLMCAAL